MTWLLTHGATLLELLIALHGVALIIVNLTPTPADDRLLGKAYRAVEIIAGLIRPVAKQWPGEKDFGPIVRKPRESSSEMDAVDDWLDR